MPFLITLFEISIQKRAFFKQNLLFLLKKAQKQKLKKLLKKGTACVIIYFLENAFIL